MSLDFLSAGEAAADGAVARSPMEAKARAAGARFDIRDGWNVAHAYADGAEEEARAATRTAGWADVSHLGKLELQGPPDQLDRIASECGAEELVLARALGGRKAAAVHVSDQTRAVRERGNDVRFAELGLEHQGVGHAVHYIAAAPFRSGNG